MTDGLEAGKRRTIGPAGAGTLALVLAACGSSESKPPPAPPAESARKDEPKAAEPKPAQPKPAQPKPAQPKPRPRSEPPPPRRDAPDEARIREMEAQAGRKQSGGGGGAPEAEEPLKMDESVKRMSEEELLRRYKEIEQYVLSGIGSRNLENLSRDELLLAKETLEANRTAGQTQVPPPARGKPARSATT